MKEFWNSRYEQSEYAYGKLPNTFFAEQIKLLTPGKLLLPCEGEGRNAVFAAQQNWEVTAFDVSTAGKEKALKLANEKGITIHYSIDEAAAINFAENEFDAIALIYAHFPTTVRKNIHEKIIRWLKPNGKLILEAFNPKQLELNSGGPKELSMLYTSEMLMDDFSSLKIDYLETTKVHLNEGDYHKGEAEIIRLIATKI